MAAKRNEVMDLRVINFPDKVFKKYLVDNFDKDGDGEISFTEAQSITSIDCPKRGIKSLAGIEFLPYLKDLDCSNNDIEDLNVSMNPHLESLRCYQNHHLHGLDLRNNRFLKVLYCGGCNMQELDISHNQELRILSCYFNSIKEINVMQHKNLHTLKVRRCALKELDLRNNEKLEFLDCSENDLSGDLYLGATMQLKYLDCRCNPNLQSIMISDGQHIEKVSSENLMNRLWRGKYK